MTEGAGPMEAIALERLTRRIRLDPTAGPLPLGPGGGTWSRVVTEVQVTYHREVEDDVPIGSLMWVTDEVTLVGGDGTVMQREVLATGRELVRAVTLRWRRAGRKRPHDLGLETVPEWLDELVEAYRPPEEFASTAAGQPLWRVGEHYGIHVYEGNRPVATFHRPEDAARAVAAVRQSG